MWCAGFRWPTKTQLALLGDPSDSIRRLDQDKNQGNRMKFSSIKQGEEIVIIPACPFAFDLDANFSGFLLFA